MITEEFKIHSRNLEEWIRKVLTDYGIENVDEIGPSDLYPFFSRLKHNDENFLEFTRRASREKYHQMMSDPVLHEYINKQNRIRYHRCKIRSQFPGMSYSEVDAKAHEEYDNLQKRKEKIRIEREQRDARRQEREAKRNLIQQKRDAKNEMRNSIRTHLRSEFPHISDEELERLTHEEYQRTKQRIYNDNQKQKREEQKRNLIQQMADSMASGNS